MHRRIGILPMVHTAEPYHRSRHVDDTHADGLELACLVCTESWSNMRVLDRQCVRLSL